MWRTGEGRRGGSRRAGEACERSNGWRRRRGLDVEDRDRVFRRRAIVAILFVRAMERRKEIHAERKRKDMDMIVILKGWSRP